MKLPSADDTIEFGRSLLRRVERSGRREFHRLTHRVRPRVMVVWHPSYRLHENSLVDARRADRIAEHLGDRGWLGRNALIDAGTLPLSAFLRVHSAEYLEALDDPRTVVRIAGNVIPVDEAAKLVAMQRHATAGTVAAAKLAHRKEGSVIAVNLSGGFHHAHRGRAGGFCVFNDIAIAIDQLRLSGFHGHILVVDLDLHQGEGTKSLLAEDDGVFTYSLHVHSLDASVRARNLDVVVSPGASDTTYLAALRESLPPFFREAAPEFVFYVAGVDVAADDKMAAFRLSPSGVLARDEVVFDLAKGLPTVMTLAGGYGPSAWRYTARTLYSLLAGEDIPIASRDEQALNRFRRIRRSISSGSLRAETSASPNEPLTLTEEDIYGSLVAKTTRDRLLGFYTPFGLEVAFERYGLAKHLRDRGYPRFVIQLDDWKSGSDGFRVFADPKRKIPIMEITVVNAHSDLEFPSEESDETKLVSARLLSVEWLLLQDPNRVGLGPLLPGQKYPGLGCVDIVMGMMVMVCERLGYDGLTFVPAHYHVAARARPLMRFIDPKAEAFFVTLAARGLSIRETSARLARGEITDLTTKEPLAWQPARMVFPASLALQRAFDSQAYAQKVERAARQMTWKS